MTQASVVAWETPWTEEPGELRFSGPQRVRTLSTLAPYLLGFPMGNVCI